MASQWHRLRCAQQATCLDFLDRNPANRVAARCSARGDCARMSSLEMNWPYLKRNIPGIITWIVVVGGLLFLWVINPDLTPRKTNYGFGPEWDCYSPGRGGPICFKRAEKPD